MNTSQRGRLHGRREMPAGNLGHDCQHIWQLRRRPLSLRLLVAFIRFSLCLAAAVGMCVLTVKSIPPGYEDLESLRTAAAGHNEPRIKDHSPLHPLLVPRWAIGVFDLMLLIFMVVLLVMICFRNVR